MFTVTDLKHYAYCPVIIYVKYVLGFEEPMTEYMLYGKEIELEKALVALVKYFRGVKVLRSINLYSRRLGLSGRVDYVIITKFNDYVPVDIKWCEVIDKPRTDHVVQIAGYALLLEECLKCRVKVCGIYYITSIGGKIFTIMFSEELRRRILSIINDLKNIVKGKLPKVKRRYEKCVNCNYSSFCPLSKV